VSAIRVAGVAAAFGRDLAFDLARITGIVDHARRAGVALLVLPDAALGGYLADLHDPDPDALPPALAPDDPLLGKVAAAAADMVVCLGYCEAGPDGRRYNSAVCLTGDGPLGSHRKVHQPAGESAAYAPGDAFRAFDTPVGRLGMLIDYDTTFPESARAVEREGAGRRASATARPR